MNSDDSKKEPLPSEGEAGEPQATPREVRVRFGMYGAGLMMVLCFMFQAVVSSTQTQTERITELGVLMLVGYLLGWVFARIRF
ncbi:MAG: hypothetical protein K0U86_11165 [Planctomycetes bacterium]|nr:hypothetical protein [Planctomycetota bacterium]MCH9725441.1 hypothetical protein [Planctomycetota bacterium]MCH9776538.1 hypothetical protein [Planctomycetota bacterium]MCH9789553.1 hypothetical protein [Planctomycetota bacterium]MDF1742313.1 hypothetical protein [Gimesia sp.]